MAILKLRPGTRETTWLALAAIVGIIALYVIINFWIYFARIEFIAGHPDYVARKPPTISRAISDPEIGVPFAQWITVSAIIFPFIFLVITSLYAETARAASTRLPRLARLLVAGAVALLLLKTLAATGMYLLSNYRVPDNGGTHMIGSYLFFISDAILVLVGSVMNLFILRHLPYDSADTPLISRLGARVRVWPGFVAVFLGFLYLGLFVLKEIDLGPWDPIVYQAYVLDELFVITAMMTYFLTYTLDLWALIRRPAGVGIR